MKKFIALKIVDKSNPVLFAIRDILRVEPSATNELRSYMHLESETAAVLVDEPTSSVEEKLCKK